MEEDKDPNIKKQDEEDKDENGDKNDEDNRSKDKDNEFTEEESGVDIIDKKLIVSVITFSRSQH